MKHILTSILLLLALLLPATIMAYDFEVDGIYYNINGNEVTVTSGSRYSGSVNIPSSVTYNGTTYSVTTIGASAFRDCSELTDINIPNSVTTISDLAFYSCEGLTNINIPNSVTTIGNAAFSYCSGLTNITVAQDNPNYDSRDNCNAIIETASNTLVAGCMNTIIPNSITTIDYYGFNGCSTLTNINIPNSVTTIGKEAFTNCSGLTNITVAQDNPNYDSRDNCNAIIETASNKLIRGCINTIIPNSVTTIGNDAFSSCYGLTNINIPNSVTTISEWAFSSCTELTNINIPNSVTTISKYAFSYCSGLTNINIPNSVTTIGNGAFTYCSGLKEVHSYITDLSSISMDGMAFSLSSAYSNYGDRTLYVPYGTSADYQADPKWSRCFGSIVEMIISFEVDGIYYIMTNGNIVEVTKNPTNYTGDITIPDSVTYDGTTYMVTTIGDQAFANCTGLTSITIPSSVTAVGKQAFMNDAAIETVKCEATTPPSWDGLDMFTTDVYNNTPLIVPSGCARAYMTDECWGQFIKIVEPGDANMDGTISISDVTSLIDLLLTNGDSPTADANGDGFFTIIDVAYVIDLLLSSK